MCGIAGVLLYDDDSMSEAEKRKRKEAAILLFTEILLLTETRGRDATGVTALFKNGDYLIQKGAFPAAEFISNYGKDQTNYDQFIEICRKKSNDISTLIGHCRKSSVGNKIDNENNHPIKAGEIVGIHNGTLKNHDIIFKKLKCKRDGTVDSEAIFRLLEMLTNDCQEPFTLQALTETVSRLQGSYSCLAYNANNPFQVAAFRRDRPLEFCLIKNLKMMLITSEMTFYNQALFHYNKAIKLFKFKLPIITKSDVVTAMLPNDSVSILDLTKEITDKTVVADLVDKKYTTSIVKKWQEKTTYSYYNQSNYYNNQTKANTSRYTNTTKNKQTNSNTSKTIPNKSTKKNIFEGLVFCKELYKFVPAEEVKKASSIGATSIEKDTGEITDLETFIKKEDNKRVKKEVALDTLQEVSLAAKTEEGYKYLYKGNEELILDLGIKSIHTLKQLEPYALCNKIRGTIFEEGFIAGACYVKKDEERTKKENKATKIIAAAKKVIEITTLSAEINKTPKEAQRDAKLSLNVPDVTVPNKKILRKLFSVGDFTNSPTLQTIYENAVE